MKARSVPLRTPAITPEIMLRAYAAGIFPMAESADDPGLFWVEPELRGIIPLGRIGTLQEMPAVFVLGFWFVLQLFNGIASLGVPTASGGGVAFFAHIGGFVVGVVVTWLFMRLVPQPPRGDRNRMLYQRARRYPF